MDAQATGEGCALPTGGFLRFFRDLPDPRAANAVHRLDDILVIAVCAVICGADTWVDVETFGNAKLPWLSTFLTLPHGIPSHDTFGRVFAALNPDAFERCFARWMAALRKPGTRLVAIDGKSIRRSFQHAWDASGMAHLVSAFATANGGLTFAQVATAGKGQELAAMRQLLDLLALDEATVVTIDALGCQRDVAQRIVAKDADYVLAVKENQPALHAAVKRVLDEALLERFAGLRHDYCASTCGDHGRVETRRVWVSDEAVTHLGETAHAWPGLGSVAVVESTRQVIGSGKPSVVERRYYISSIDGDPDARRIGEVIRGHWGIENGLHWQLDVSFGEDLRRVRKDHGAENFSRLCRIALNLLKSETTTKVGVKGKRLKAGWDEPYLLRLLTG